MTRLAVSALLATLVLAGCGTAAVPFGATQGAAQLDALRKLKAPAVKAENFKQVDAKLYRLGLPSDEDMAALAKAGVKTDISLQSDRGPEAAVVAKEKEMAKKHGITFVHLPLPFSKDPPVAMLKKYLDIFHDPASLPAMIHCKHGRDRTGTMVAVYRIAENGWTNEKAFAEMKTFGFQPKDYPVYAKFVQTFKPGSLTDAKPKKRTKREEEEATFVEEGPILGFWVE